MCSKFNKIFVGLISVLLLAGCEVDIEKSVLNSAYYKGTVNAGNLNTSGFKVESLLESTELGNGKFTVQAFSCEYPQYLSVKNENGEPVMLFRERLSNKREIEINARTTAIAVLTFHPVLGTVYGDDYDELVSIITSTEHFNVFLSAVEQSVADNRYIYDTTNTRLINAAKDVFTELLGDTTRLYYDGSYSTAYAKAKSTSPLTELYGCWPIDVRAEGNKLKFRVPGCCPSYWCKVYDENAEYTGENFVVPTRENYGALNVIKCLMGQSDWLYGAQVEYTFPKVNEHRTFFFDRGGLAGQADKGFQLAGCILQMLGVFYDDKIIEEVSSAISEALTVMEGGNWQDHIWNLVPLAIKATLDVLSNPSSNSYIANYVGYHAINIAKTIAWINFVEGGSNLLLRTVWNFLSDLEYAFCSQYYPTHTFGLCSDYIRIIRGNNQTGLPNTSLDEPLAVEVVSDNWDDLQSRNYKVKFVAKEGCGSFSNTIVPLTENNTASSEWTLGSGQNETQYAYAILMDMDNNTILDSVMFSATIERNLWQVNSRCQDYGSYTWSYILDLGNSSSGIINIGPETVYGYDYDGKNLKVIYSGTYNASNRQLIIDEAEYTVNDKHHFRTDRFTVTLSNNNVSVTGVLIYDDGAGCVCALDVNKISGNNKKKVQLTDNTSRTTGCKLYGGL
ncbi:MAG: hypothetical protein IJ684_02325 [Bacteroidales bacterium]|nr:hypothetical protein [Bacteroidales bacterium]